MDEGKNRKDIGTLGLMEGIVLFIGLFVCTFIAFRKMDPDLFFLINNGRHISQTKDLFPQMLFSSIHRDFSTVIQQPLWSLVLYLLFSSFGITSIPFFICFFILSCTLLLFSIYSGIGNSFTRTGLVTFSLIIICLTFSGRPSTFSVTNILLSICVLEKIKDGRMDNRSALILYPFSTLELLCHASFFPVILFIQSTYLISFDMKSTLRKYRYLMLSLVLSIVSSFLTPYRAKLPLYFFYSYGSAKYGDIVVELRRPTIDSIYTLLMMIALVAVGWQLWKKHADGVLLSIAGIIALMLHTRNIYILGVLIVPMFKNLFKEQEAREGVTTEKSGKKLSFSFFIPLLLVVLYMIKIATLYKGFAIKDAYYSPVLACDYLFDNYESGTIYCGFNQGAFLEFNGFESYIDARPELYFKRINQKEDIYPEYVSLSLSEDFDYNSFIEKYAFKYFISETDTYFYNHLEQREGIQRILDGDGYSLFMVEE